MPRSTEAPSAALQRGIACYVADRLAASSQRHVWWSRVLPIRKPNVEHLCVTARRVPPSPPTPRNFLLRTASSALV